MELNSSKVAFIDIFRRLEYKQLPGSYDKSECIGKYLS